MALDAAYAKNLAAKAPMEDDSDMVALGGAGDDEGAEGEDEDANAAVSQSAFDDFAKAAGFKASPGAYAAFKEAVHACMKG